MESQHFQPCGMLMKQYLGESSGTKDPKLLTATSR